MSLCLPPSVMFRSPSLAFVVYSAPVEARSNGEGHGIRRRSNRMHVEEGRREEARGGRRCEGRVGRGGGREGER